MFFIKGLLIFSPIFIYSFVDLSWKSIKVKITATLFILMISLILFSPYSFKGWLIDYVVFFIGISIALNLSAKTWSKKLISTIKFLGVLAFIKYSIFTTLFGSETIDTYNKNGLTFRIHKYPDLVSSPTYKLKIDKTWGIFENELYNSQIDGIIVRHLILIKKTTNH